MVAGKAFGMSIAGSEVLESKASMTRDIVSAAMPLKQAWLSVASFSFALGPAIGLGYSCFAPIGSQIAQQLGDPTITAWVLNAWTLASSISFLTCGYISDVCGRRRLLTCGSCIGIVGFLVCAVAQNVPTLIAGQAILGLSAGFLFVVYSAAAEVMPPEWRSTAVGVIDCGFALWASVYVLIANCLLSRSTWRWIFYIGIMLETTGLVGIVTFYRPPPKIQKLTFLEKAKHFDMIGLLLFTGGITSLLVGLMWAGTAPHQWNSVSTICPIILGITVIIGSIAWDAMFAEMPVLPWSILRQFRKFSSLSLVILTTGMTFFPMLAYLPQGFFVMFTTDPIKVGVLSLPNTIGQGVVILFGTIMVRKLGRLKPQLVFVVALQVVFNAASTSAFRPSKLWSFVFLPAVSMSTFGMISILNITLLSANVPHSLLGTAIAFNSSMRTAGGALGSAIYKVIFEHTYRKAIMMHAERLVAEGAFQPEVSSKIVQACLSLDFRTLASLTVREPAVMGKLMKMVQDSYGRGLQMLFCAAVAFSAIALLATLCLDDRSSKVDAHLDNGGHAPAERKGTPSV